MPDTIRNPLIVKIHIEISAGHSIAARLPKNVIGFSFSVIYKMNQHFLYKNRKNNAEGGPNHIKSLQCSQVLQTSKTLQNIEIQNIFQFRVIRLKGILKCHL